MIALIMLLVLTSCGPDPQDFLKRFPALEVDVEIKDPEDPDVVWKTKAKLSNFKEVAQ